MLTKYTLKNLDCANCALRIENHLRRLPGVSEASINFATLTLCIDSTDIARLRREIARIEEGVEIESAGRPRNRPLEAADDGFRPGRELVILSIALILFLVQLFLGERIHRAGFLMAEYAVGLIAYLLAGGNVLRGAWRSLRRGTFFDENILMTIATLGAFAIHALSEAVGVMIFFKVGEFLQNLAVSRSRRSIRALLEIRPDHANLVAEGSRLGSASAPRVVAPEDVRTGDVILIRPGERVPLDGTVIEGDTQINAAALTGESVPVVRRPGEEVLAGEVNLSGVVLVRVIRPFAESSVAKILDLVENAAAKKAPTEQFISRFARYYTPAVIAVAAGIAFLPPLLVAGQAFSVWIYRALVLLVISCPCALVISIPLGYFGGIGGASRRGILVKGANFLEVLAGVRTVVFDKTGTLTMGVFAVRRIVPVNGFSEPDILRFAALAESHSGHPIARSIAQAAAARGVTADAAAVIEHRDVAGQGVLVRTAEHALLAGNAALLRRENIPHAEANAEGTVVHVAADGVYAGYIAIGDELKHDAREAIAALRRIGVRRIVMLTGDNEPAARIVARELALDEYRAGLLPEQKVQALEEIETRAAGRGKVAFVGDGINDAPVIVRADVGIAMGALGSDAAIESADVVLMTDQLSKVAEAIAVGRRTRAIVWQNIIFALAVKVVFVALGSFGLAGMWEAVFADMGTALLAILNSVRALRRSRPG